MSTEIDLTPQLSPARQWAALAVLVLAVLVISIDNTVLGFAVPALSADLQPSATELLWIVDAYPFVLAGLLVTMGNLGDRIGRRRLLLIGAAGFAVTSAMAAFSTSPAMLIASRALLGVAGATLMPSTLSLIRTTFPDPARRRVAIGLWSSCFAVGASLGPIVGGWLLEHFWWGSVFLLAVPFMVLLIVAAPVLVPESRNPQPGPFDLLSNIMSLGAVLPVVYAMKQAAEHGPAIEHALIALIGVIVGVGFVRRQRQLTEPLFDMDLFSNRPFATAVTANMLTNFALVGSIFLVAQYLQMVTGLGPLSAGWHLIPGMATAFVASLTAAALMRKIQPGHLMGIGLVAGALGMLVMTGIPGSGSPVLVVIAMAFIGLGCGGAASVGANLVMAIVPARRAGSASAISETAFELGAAAGLAVLGSTTSAIYRRRMGSDPEVFEGVPAAAEAQASDNLSGAFEVAFELPAEAAQRLISAGQEAFAGGVRGAAVVAGVLLVTGAAAVAWSMRGVKVSSHAPH